MGVGESFLSRVVIVLSDRRKGSGLKFPHTDVKAATQIEVETFAVALGRVFFSV